MKRTIFFKRYNNGATTCGIWAAGLDRLFTLRKGDTITGDSGGILLKTDALNNVPGYETGIYFTLEELDKQKCNPVVTGTTLNDIFGQILDFMP